jgi:hypothetical protein
MKSTFLIYYTILMMSNSWRTDIMPLSYLSFLWPEQDSLSLIQSFNLKSNNYLFEISLAMSYAVFAFSWFTFFIYGEWWVNYVCFINSFIYKALWNWEDMISPITVISPIIPPTLYKASINVNALLSTD